MYIRKFLWEGGKQENRKFHLVNWKTIKLPELRGGLVIRDSDVANLVKGEKLWWIIETSRDKWWVQVIRAKYINKLDDSDVRIEA